MAQLDFTLSGATGTELRFQNYGSQPDSPGTAYAYDPQGNLTHLLSMP